ncbi:hypothetical protein REPUB_Repub13aG0152900 [Reevesia pubescens]
MLSMSLHISFSGLLNYILAYFTERIVFVLLELKNQDRASNMFETQNLDSMQLLQQILPMKKIQFASSEMELDSSRKKFSELRNSEAASSSSKYTTRSNQSRLVSADFNVKQEQLFSKFRNEGASSSKKVVKNSRVIINNKACSSFCKGKVVLQASEGEELKTRLKILEEENEILKQAFLETVVERKQLANEICQLFQTLRYSLHHKDQEDGHKSSFGSLIIKHSKGQGGGTAESSLSQVLLEKSSFRRS